MTPNVEVQGPGAASSRTVPCNDGLAGTVLPRLTFDQERTVSNCKGECVNMNMEKPQALDARDLDTAVKETQFKAQELRRQANKLRDDAKTLEAEAAGWEGAADMMQRRLETLIKRTQANAG